MRISTTATLFGVLMLATGPASAADPTQSAATTTPPAAKPVNVIDGDKIVCKSFAQTGSRFTKKVCLTKAEWLYEHSSAVDAFRNNHPLDRKY